MSTAEGTAGGRIPEWTIGERLRKVRDDAHLSPQEMADLIGVSARTVNNYEKLRGKRGVPLRSLFAYATTMGVSIHWLRGDPEPESEPGSVDRRVSRGVTHGYRARHTLRTQRDQAALPDRHLQLARAV